MILFVQPTLAAGGNMMVFMNGKLRFEVSKSAAFKRVLMPVTTVLLVSSVFMLGFMQWLIGTTASSVDPELSSGLYRSVGAGIAFGSFLTFIITLYMIRYTAYSLELDEQSLTIKKLWGKQRLLWNEVADVQVMRRLWQRFLYLRTWDGNYVQLCPPLEDFEKLQNELTKRAESAISAPSLQTEPSEKLRRQTRLFFAEVGWQFKIAGITFLSILILLLLFIAWQSLRNPILDVESYCEKQQLKPGENLIKPGKKSYLQTFYIKNAGRSFSGMNVTVSGNAFTSGQWRNPEVLIVSDQHPRWSFQDITSFKRELIPMKRDGSGAWHCTLPADLTFQHQDDLFVQAVLLPVETIRPHISMEQQIKVFLFADVERAGKGVLKADFVPSTGAQAAVSHTVRLQASKAAVGIEPVCSVRIPARDPVSQCPRAVAVSLDENGAQLRAAGGARAAVQYYSDELTKKGWHTKCTNNRGGMYNIDATKGGRIIKIDIMDMTPCKMNVDIRIWYFS